MATRVIYHVNGQQTPYLVRVDVPPRDVTLGDFKRVLNKQNYRYYFRSVDEDVGEVKEEICDDDAKLPCYNGRVISWLVSAGSCQSEDKRCEAPPPQERPRGIGASRPPSFQAHTVVCDTQQREDVCLHGSRGAEPGSCDSSSTPLSSESDVSSFCESEREGPGRFSQSTESRSSQRPVRRRRRRKPKALVMERSESVSSVTDSTMSLHITTVTLNMDSSSVLGISVVGQTSQQGDGGIYIGAVMKGGAVAADGRIQPGDLLLQVNDVNFEDMTNDEAVRVLREVVNQPGCVTLTVAKCWDTAPQGFTLPRSEPVRPIDPAAWVSHTAAMTGSLPPHYGLQEDEHLSLHTDLVTVAKAMSSHESGLEVRDRMWLKVTIAQAFIGSDVVDWLYGHVEGLSDRREARRLATSLLEAGLIRHTVNKSSFSDQCYYTFGELDTDMGVLSLEDAGGGAYRAPLSLPSPGEAPGGAAEAELKTETPALRSCDLEYQ